MHPYGDSSSQPPTFAHPLSTSIGIADYGKLVSLLGEAFDGTAQPGSALPIVYGEYGVETQIPSDKASLYSGAEIRMSTKPVDPATQAAYYHRRLPWPSASRRSPASSCSTRRRACAARVAVGRCTTPDGTPKPSLPAVTAGVRQDGGRLDRALSGGRARGPRHLSPLRHALGRQARRVPRQPALRSRLRVTSLRLEKLPGHATREGHARPGDHRPARAHRPAVAAPPRGHVPLHDQPRPAGQPGAADGPRRRSVHASVASIAVLDAPTR